jgi:hypothetical protein
MNTYFFREEKVGEDESVQESCSGKLINPALQLVDYQDITY